MKYIFLSSLLLFAATLYSQSSEKKINVTVGKFAGAAPSTISGIRIVLSCPDTLTLGYIPAEKGNETYKLVPEKNFTRWLDTLVELRYASGFVPSGRRLLWLFRDLSITADTTGRYCFTRVKTDVFFKKDDQTIAKLLSLDTVFTGQINDNDGYAIGIINTLDQVYSISIIALKSIVQENSPVHVKEIANDRLTEDSIFHFSSMEYALPILEAPVPSVGAYATFSEFLHNTPSISGTIWAVPDTLQSGQVNLFSMGPDSTIIPLTAVWGVCFGGNELYKYEQGQLIPIEKAGNGFVLSRYQDPVVRRNQALYWRHIAKHGWPNNTNPYDRDKMLIVKVNYLSQLANTEHQPVATRIDMSTGQLSF